jgi:hypothetical protein
MRRFATLEELRRGISTEIVIAMGLPRVGLHQRLLAPLIWPVAHRFAKLAAGFDRMTAESGFPAAARWALLQFVEDVRAIGTEQIPREGPLIIASNHPGSYDSLVITSQIQREDLRIIVSDVPILRGMHATSPHFIYVPHDPHVRMAAIRESIRHLKAGGAVLLFASSQVDPDPALLPGAVEALEKWSASAPLLMRQVPNAKLVIAITREVLAPSCYNHPLPQLRSEQRLKQFTAEFLQIGQQLLFGRRFHLTPAVSFSKALTPADLGGTQDLEAARQAMISVAQRVIESGTRPES